MGVLQRGEGVGVWSNIADYCGAKIGGSIKIAAVEAGQ